MIRLNSNDSAHIIYLFEKYLSGEIGVFSTKKVNNLVVYKQDLVLCPTLKSITTENLFCISPLEKKIQSYVLDLKEKCSVITLDKLLLLGLEDYQFLIRKEKFYDRSTTVS